MMSEASSSINPHVCKDSISDIDWNDNKQPEAATSTLSNTTSLLGKLYEYVISSSPSSFNNNHQRTKAEKVEAGILSPSPPESTPVKTSYRRGARSTSLSLHTPSSFLNSPIHWGALSPGYAPNLVPQPPVIGESVVTQLALSAEPMSKSSANIAANLTSIGSIDDIDVDPVTSTMSDDSSVKSTPKVTRLNRLYTPSPINGSNQADVETLNTPARTPLPNNVVMDLESPIFTEEDNEDELLSTPVHILSTEVKPCRESWILATSPLQFGLPIPASTINELEETANNTDFLDDNDAGSTLLDEAPPFMSSRTSSDLYLNEYSSASVFDASMRESITNSRLPVSIDDTQSKETKPILVSNGEIFQAENDNMAQRVEIPADWMLSTPCKSFANSSKSGRRTSDTGTTSSTLIDITSPQNLAKYSEKDVDRIKNELHTQFETELQLVRDEMRHIMAQRAASAQKYHKIQNTLAEWEQTMKEMIAESQKERKESHDTIETLQLTIDQLKGDASRLTKERDRAKKASVLLESIQKDNEELKEKMDLAQRDLNIAQQRYDVLKAHAEEKLESANVEIAKVRASYEKEISTYKVRMQKAELQASSLQKLIEQKTAENIELSKICDQLIAHVQEGGIT